jgi:hypothetical protein
MQPVRVWPSSLPRVKFTFLMDFSPPRPEIIMSLDSKLYTPIANALWFRVKGAVMEGCGCNYYPPTCSAEEFFHNPPIDNYGAVEWDLEINVSEWEKMIDGENNWNETDT